MFSLKNDFYELKFRCFYIIISLLFSFLIGYLYRSEVLFLFSKPLVLLMGKSSKMSFIYTHLGEALFAQIKASFIISILCSFVPLFFINLWLYIIPGLFVYERGFLKSSLLLFFVFSVLGFLIGYNLILPFAWEFLISFSVSDNSLSSPFSVLLEARIKDYIDLVFNLVCIIFLVFQIPLIIIVLLSLRVISLNFCTTHRRYFLLISWIVAACVTPPDIVSQALVAVPLYGFVELTFLSCYCLEIT
tara:strand:+ start:753 stop:1490 length:738 start_codon:yes stop_codon:yes gene_type:complete